MKGSFGLSFTLSVILIGMAMMIFPEHYFSHYWMFLRSAYLLTLLSLIFALHMIIRAIRMLLAYIVEIPRSAKQARVRIYIYWLILFISWFLVVLLVFPWHTLVIASTLSIREAFKWWQKRKKSFTFE